MDVEPESLDVVLPHFVVRRIDVFGSLGLN